MILSYAAILRARMVSSHSWIGPMLREHLVPGDVLSLGFRAMVAGLRMVLLGYLLSLFSLCWLGPESYVTLTFIGSAVAGCYLFLAGKLACLFAPVGRWMIGLHLLLGFTGLFAYVENGEAGLVCLAASSCFFLAFIHRIGQHFQRTAMLRRLRVALFLYGMALTGPLSSLMVLPRELENAVFLTASLALYLGLWIYSGCLAQASAFLAQSAKPLRPLVLCKALASGFARSLKTSTLY